MNTHFNICRKPLLSAQFDCTNSSSFCSFYSSHPIMPSNTVKANTKLRSQIATLKFVKYTLRQKPTVCVHLTQRNFMHLQPIHQLPKIPSYKWFATSNIDFHHTARCHLINQINRLLMIQFSICCIRGIHITMTTTVVTSAGNRPKRSFYVSIVIILVTLLIINRQFFVLGNNKSSINKPLQYTFHLLRQIVFKHLCFSVAEQKRLKFNPVKHTSNIIWTTHQNPRHTLPTF